MAMSTLSYILGFSVRFFQPMHSVYEYYEIKITSKSFVQKFELKWYLGGPLSKLCVTPPFFLSTFDVKLKTKWAITGSWEPLVYFQSNFDDFILFGIVGMVSKIKKYSKGS